jgi:hypothetical protein
MSELPFDRWSVFLSESDSETLGNGVPYSVKTRSFVFTVIYLNTSCVSLDLEAMTEADEALAVPPPPIDASLNAPSLSLLSTVKGKGKGKHVSETKW